MGIIPSGILGPVYNKTGAVVGRKKGKKNIISGMPRIRPRETSEAQSISRSKLGLLNWSFSRIAPMINQGFQAYKKDGSARNAAYTFNAKHAFLIGENAEVTLNFPALVLSRGSIVAPLVRSVRRENDQVIFEWQAQPQSQYCLASDRASFLLMEKNQGVNRTLAMNVVRRDALRFAIQLEENQVSQAYHCYLCFAAENGKTAGNSVYLGLV